LLIASAFDWGLILSAYFVRSRGDESMDRYNKEKRSMVMTRVKKSYTKLEERLAAVLNAEGLDQYDRYRKDLPGSPDFVFQQEKVVIFLDSCFWHGCPKHLRMPASNVDYWENKIAINKERDRRQTRELRKSGWRVLRLWEHELKEPERVIGKIRRALESQSFESQSQLDS
jgi:DNA mismatch endonuclease (patch repair protein)